LTVKKHNENKLSFFIFHIVIVCLCIFADIYHGRGNGGESIYGPVFEGILFSRWIHFLNIGDSLICQAAGKTHWSAFCKGRNSRLQVMYNNSKLPMSFKANKVSGC